MVSENKNLKEGFEENEMVAVYCVKRHNLFFVAWDLIKCAGYFRIVCVLSFFIILLMRTVFDEEINNSLNDSSQVFDKMSCITTIMATLIGFLIAGLSLTISLRQDLFREQNYENSNDNKPIYEIMAVFILSIILHVITLILCVLFFLFSDVFLARLALVTALLSLLSIADVGFTLFSLRTYIAPLDGNKASEQNRQAIHRKNTGKTGERQ